MSYVQTNLLENEKIVYLTGLSHRLFRAEMGIFACLFGFVLLWGLATKNLGGALEGIIFFSIPTGLAYFNFKTAEFAVTNKRVIMKVGILRRRTLELLLSKIESISLDQGILDRLNGVGTIVIIGSGGTRESFRNIDNPAEFKRQVQIQIDANHTTHLKTGT